MEISLHQEELTWYSPVFSACVSQEFGADSVVPDRLPDVSRVLDTDASVYLRRRIAAAGEITLEGDIRAAVLFQGEGDPALRKLDFELPCTFSIPAEGVREEDRLRARLVMTRAEGRIINPRKLGLTVEVRAIAELYRGDTAAITTGADSDELETLLREETLTYAAQVEEKSFSVMEECQLPAGHPAIREILHARADADITDQKTVGGKSILQGSARWELRYLDTEGEIRQERFTVPFSQLMDIPEEAVGDGDVILTAESAYAEIIPSPGGTDTVSLELHLLAQSLCWARRTMTVLSDVYSIRRPCQTETARLALSAPAEHLMLRGTADSSLEQGERISTVLCSYVQAGIPEVSEGSLLLPVRFHALCRTEDGELSAVKRSLSLRFPGVQAPETLRFGEPMCAEPGLTVYGDRLELHLTAELPALRLAETPVCFITRAELGEETASESSAPSLIVLRPGERSLWELGKRYHSTVELIRAANPEPKELLLIPRAR
ncbi:MAG: DUF3794 domain-containing protein [Oscillospiraceae bacterium]|nr:DUF3794 domain-containing protein [Oscillospiraceae bacterium]